MLGGVDEEEPAGDGEGKLDFFIRDEEEAGVLFRLIDSIFFIDAVAVLCAEEVDADAVVSVLCLDGWYSFFFSNFSMCLEAFLTKECPN